MKLHYLILLMVSVLLFTSFCFSQEGIQQKRDIDSTVKIHQNYELMNPVSLYPASLHPALKNPPSQSTYSDSVNTAWMRYYGSGLAKGEDQAKAIATDSFGNVVVTGSSVISPYCTEFYTIKYNYAGNELWNARYNNGEGTENIPYSICIDRYGNIYVTGSSDGAGSYSDIVTIKYNPNGDTLWVRRYNGTGNSVDFPCTMELDRTGYVYVGGTSVGLNTGYDLITIKYDSIGNTVWASRYDGPVNQDDVASAQHVDDSGNVYIAGCSIGLTAYNDYVVIKYSPNGDSEWVGRYDGPGTDEDFATALAVDDSGNVVVTGYSTSLGNNYDYATIKYNASGEMVWLRRYNGSWLASDRAYVLGIDSSENVYVSGYSGSYTLCSYVTIKYNRNGDTVWTKLYEGQGKVNSLKSLIFDTSGNFFVCNNSTILKYTGSGEVLWVSRTGPENPAAFVIDDSGNAYVTGSTGGADDKDKYATYKYDPNGNSVWSRQYDATGNSYELSNAIAVDRLGNVYVTGGGDASEGMRGCITIKYNQYGDTLWVRRMSGDAYSTIGIDGAGNVYITSLYNTFDEGTHQTMKYSSDGDLAWVRHFYGPGNKTFYARAQVVDKEGNVYVTGFSKLTTSINCFTTIKCNSNGDTLWIRSYNGNGDSTYYARALAVDDSGNVFVTGGSGSYSSSRYTTIKYNPVGDTVWVRYYKYPGISTNGATAIGVDGSGNVYVAGNSNDENDNHEYATIKYTSDGESLWVRRYKGKEYWGEPVRAMVIDRSGNVYMSVTSGSLQSNDQVTIKYNTNGDTVWVCRYHKPASVSNVAIALAIDRFSNVYVAGVSLAWYKKDVSTIIKYNLAGDSVWAYQTDGTGYVQNLLNAIAVDSSGNVYATGQGEGNHGSKLVTIKYLQSPDGVIEQPLGVPTASRLEQNYPNPFNPTTRLSFVIGHSSLVTLRVYDILGKEVATVLNNRKYETGSYEIPFDASHLANGIYFYRLEAESIGNPSNSFTEVKKMVVVR